MKRSIPHPSITGLASGALIANFINQGPTTGASVLQAAKEGDFEKATNRFLVYSQKLVTDPTGRSDLISAITIAAGGALVRKMIPNIKLGGTKIYARI